MNILGISAYYHDSAACLIQNGKIVAAAQEERFTRKKHDDKFPKNAVNYCLEQGKIHISDIDYVVFYEKPFLKFERILETYLSVAPFGISSFIKAIPTWLKNKLWLRLNIANELNYKGKILFTEHHESHAGSAFFPSPFERAAFLTLDGVGEHTTTSYGVGEKNKIKILSELSFPHSLGMLYSAFTYYTGFKVNSGEYKIMGLAPYGESKYVDIILENLIDLKEDGSFHLNMDYFNFTKGLTMTNNKFSKLFGGDPRKPESPLTQKEMDIAKSIQDVTDIILIKIAKHIKKVTGETNLVLAGGVALNCVSNGKLLRSNIFKNIWVQPASGDAGGALGSALFVWYQYLNNKRDVDEINDSMNGSYLGPEYSNSEIKKYLETNSIPHRELSDEDIPEIISDLINKQGVIGWFQGRMEFGPRALGARSIIGDARSPKMQDTMNLKIKFRESFRPFAPSVLREKVSDYFEIEKNYNSPYMLIVANIRKEHRKKTVENKNRLFGIDLLNVVRSDIPAITHVDYSARLQTVDDSTNPLYYRMISAFNRKYNCPVIINTSFNVRGEPIVCTPKDAYMCFMRTNIDYLIMGNYLVDKSKQEKIDNDSDWKREFVLD